MELMGTNGDDQLYREEFAAVLSDEVKNDVKMEVNERAKTIRVQAAEDIHYGSAGAVLKGATGIVHGKFTGNRNVFNFVNWDAFPELGRVSAQQEKLLPMFDDQPGTYVIMREAGVTETVELAKQVVCILPAGTTVKIVEVVHRLDQKRWRGRLEEPVKGWISLLASNNGARWAEQLSAGGHSERNLPPAQSGAPTTQLAAVGSSQVDSSRQGMLHAMQPGRTSHVVLSGQRSLSAPRAATAVCGSIYSSSCPGSVAPSEAGSFRYPAQAPILQRNSSQHSLNCKTYSTASSRSSSLQLPVSTAGQASMLSAVHCAPRPMTVEDVSRRVASSSLGPQRAQSNQPLYLGSEPECNVSAPSSQEDKKKNSDEVVAALQGIKQQLKGMADRIERSGSKGHASGAVHEQAVSSTEALVKRASCEAGLPKQWIGA